MDASMYVKGLVTTPSLAEINTPPNKITAENCVVKNNGEPIRMVMSRSKIRLGCTEITPNAAKFILSEWEMRFGKAETEIVIQP